MDSLRPPDRRRDDDQRRRIAFLLIEGFDLSAFARPAEAFAVANRIAPQPRFRLHVLGLTARRARARCGAGLVIRELAGERLDYDLLFICAGETATNLESPPLLNWLRRYIRFGGALVGIDVGTWLLARAGLLGDRRPFVPPRLAPAFEETFGIAPIGAFGQEFGPSGGETRNDRRIGTAAGATAALTLALEVIAEAESESLADAVAQDLGHLPTQPAAPDLSLSQRLGVHHPALARCLDAMGRNMEKPLDKRGLTEVAGVSTRHLERLFLSHLGATPGAFYRSLRLARARHLLEHTSLPVAEVAMATGFVSASHFGRAFQAAHGSAPGELRRSRQRRQDPDPVVRIA